MEEVRRVNTTRKTKRGTTILLVLAGVLGLALIGTAIYFYTIGDAADKKNLTETTCACYYIDPTVVSECGDPRRGFIFETATVSSDQTCKAACSTSKLSINLLNSSTKQDLYQICQLQTVLDSRCSEMVVKDSSGKIVTGKVSGNEELTIEAKFDKEYTNHKLIINNQDSDPDVISPDKLTIKKTVSNLSSSTLNIVATATDSEGATINSPLCRRLIEIDQEGVSNVSEIQIQTRKDTNAYRVSKIDISVGNISEDKNLTVRFSFDKNLPDLLMSQGFTIDTAKGEVTMLESDLYNSDNFGTDKSFSQLDSIEGTVKVTAELRDDSGVIGSVSGSFNFPEFEEVGKSETVTEESKFLVSKASNVDCVERVSPDNIAQFTITIANQGTVTQTISSIKDKLPLGFTYVLNSSKINGASIRDADFVKVTNVGDTQEIVWTNESKWDASSGQSIVLVFQSQAGANALTGSNQNEVIITPTEVPADPTSLRAEAVIQVAQDCDDPTATPETETPTTPTTEEPTTPSTGIFDSVIAKIIIGIFTLAIGWFLYSRPLGKVIAQKLVESEAYKEAEITSWRVFSPKKYFEAKVIKKLAKKK